MSLLWCDYSKIHSTGIRQICGNVSADVADSIFSIAEFGLVMITANTDTWVTPAMRAWEVIKDCVLLCLTKTHTFKSSDEDIHFYAIRWRHIFTSSDEDTPLCQQMKTHFYVIWWRHTPLRHLMKTHTFTSSDEDTFTSSDEGTHLYVIRWRHTHIRHMIETHTFS